MSDHIISLMHTQMGCARRLAETGALNDHMNGFFRGSFASLAICAGSTEAFALERQFCGELSQLKEAA